MIYTILVANFDGAAWMSGYISYGGFMVNGIENNIRKVVIKIGSNVLSDDNGFVNRDILQNIVEQVCNLKRSGKQVAIVSSGAGICGVGAINKWSRRNDMNYK